MNDFLKKMFIDQAKPAMKRHSNAGGSSSGGVIEVDKLPSPTIPDPSSSGPVTNTGYIEKVYFNTSLSEEEVIAELDKLTYAEGLPMNVLLLKPDRSMILAVMKQGTMTAIADMATETYFWVNSDASTNMQIPFVGWNPDFNGELEINSEVVSDFNGLACGAENDKITNLLNMAAMLPNPEVDIEAVYKLPDETLWMIENNEWTELVERPDLETLEVTENGTYTPSVENTYYDEVNVNVPSPTGTLNIANNGTHDVKSYASANVNVPIPSGYIKPSGTMKVTKNGTFDVSSKAYVKVEDIPYLDNMSISRNGSYTVKKYNNVEVNVPVPDGYIVPEGTLKITENGTHGVGDYLQVEVDVNSSTIPEGYVDTNREIIEVDSLPNPDIKKIVPSTGYVGTVHFNTSLTTENSVIEEIYTAGYTKVDGTDMSVILVDSDQSTVLAFLRNPWAIVDIAKNTYYWVSKSAASLVGNAYVGWNPDFNGEIVINDRVTSNYIDGVPVGAKNYMLQNILYSRDYINEEAIYKLPDGTLCMHENDEWIVINNKILGEITTVNETGFVKTEDGVCVNVNMNVEYIEDEKVDTTSIVPENSKSMAKINYIGGMSYLEDGTFKPAKITEIISGDTILTLPDIVGHGLENCYNVIDFDNKKIIQRVATITYSRDDVTFVYEETEGSCGYGVPKPTDFKGYYNGNPALFAASKFVVGSIEDPSKRSDNIGEIVTNVSTIKFTAIFARGTTEAEVKDAFDGLSIVYELATPIELPLTACNYIKVANEVKFSDKPVPFKITYCKDATETV